ncbi:MAG: hypothetical protein RMM10_03420 [Anaerolineae bacterium]|uniref:hypothetical protein n=1 Tax=Thermoflexus sp. TaxID=1969742 RepID=UPI0025F565D4|nr:hypothetical protein [Thermoflexus sp.]MCS7350556.1 hypothetical protein [Thermoflexus sp.]MDW8180007.1 hypothetical protein [Anaerolineae bacterium]
MREKGDEEGGAGGAASLAPVAFHSPMRRPRQSGPRQKICRLLFQLDRRGPGEMADL